MHTYVLYSLLNAPPQVSMEIHNEGYVDTAQGKAMSWVYISRHLPSVVVFICMSTSGALSGWYIVV